MKSLKSVLPEVIAELKAPEKQDRATLIQEWVKIAGEKIAAHTKPQLSQNGDLSVWVDIPALAYELSQKHKNALLRRARKALGEKKVKSIRFFVGQIR